MSFNIHVSDYDIFQISEQIAAMFTPHFLIDFGLVGDVTQEQVYTYLLKPETTWLKSYLTRNVEVLLENITKKLSDTQSDINKIDEAGDCLLRELDLTEASDFDLWIYCSKCYKATTPVLNISGDYFEPECCPGSELLDRPGGEVIIDGEDCIRQACSTEDWQRFQANCEDIQMTAREAA